MDKPMKQLEGPPALTYSAVRDALRKVSYKPGYVVVCKHGQMNDHSVFVRVIPSGLADTLHPTQYVDITSSALFDLRAFNCIEDFIKMAVRQVLMDFEEHEMNEWLKYDGQFVKAPVH